MSYPDYELNEPTTTEDILKMLKLIYEKISPEIEANKLFYIKIPFNQPKSYLNYDTEKGEYFFSTGCEISGIKTKFTQEEINIMQEDHYFDCLNFEECVVPVEEDE